MAPSPSDVTGEPLNHEPVGTSNDLSGRVVGPVVQAGSIRDVHFHQTAHKPAAPRQLPPLAPHFTNRAGELAQLDALLDGDRAMLVVLTGPGGIGKTALALRWAHSVHSRFAVANSILTLTASVAMSRSTPAMR